MADNLKYNPPLNGADIRTDDLGGNVQVQYVKLMDGTAGGTQGIPGTTANGILVDVSRISGSVDVSGSSIDIASSALPSGAATEFTLDALNTKVTACNTGAVVIASGVITTVSAVTAITNALPAGTNNIGDVDVLTLPALVAGTANIGDVDILTIAAGDNNIGNVDIVTMPSVVIGSGTITAVTSITNAVTVNAHAVTNAGVFVVQIDGSALTALQLIDDIVHSGDAALSKYAVIGAVLDDAATATVTENQAQSLRMSSRRALLVEGVASGTAIPTSLATLPSLVAGTANIGDVDVLTLPGISGDVAHDTGDSGNPVKIGHKALAHGSNPTAVTANDRTDSYANRHGIPFVLGGHMNTIVKEFHFTTAQTNADLVTVSGGSKIVVTGIHATVAHATTVDVGVRVGLCASTLSAASSSGITGIVLSHPGIQAGGGVAIGNGGGILAIGADGEDLRITSDVPTTGSLRVIIQYFTIES